MITEKRSGENFSALNIGALNSIKNYVYDPAKIPGTFPGKLFLKDELQLSGMEISFNSLAPQAGMPFIHAHNKHEELFVCLSGEGEMKLDGELIKLQEGSCIRIAPQAERVWRNTGESELLFLVVQAKEKSLSVSEGGDGFLVDKEVAW